MPTDFLYVIGYIPAEGADLLEQTRSIRVRKLDGIDRAAAEICVVVLYGAPSPSRIKKAARVAPDQWN